MGDETGFVKEAEREITMEPITRWNPPSIFEDDSVFPPVLDAFMHSLRIAAIIGFLGVALGAFGAHGLEKMQIAPDQLVLHIKWWETASRYHLIHAAVLVALALQSPTRVWAWRLFIGGIAIFSGTLYIMGITGVKWLGAITPIGGLLLLCGWLALAFGKTKTE